jgi:hypothetical protein
MATVKETFEAAWTNFDGIRRVRTFEAGQRFIIEARRPEGISIDGFFVFQKYFVHLNFE